MNCQEALDLLYDYLDKETSEVDAQQIQEHIHKCRHCFEVYKLEGDLHAFVRAKLANDKPSHADSLRVKIMSQLDSIDREEGAVTGKKPPFWRTSYTLAAAALLVITLGAAYLVAGFYRHQDLYIPLEKAHWNAESELSAYADVSHTNLAMSFATDSVGYQPRDAVDGYHLVGGHVEEIDGARMVHFVYANDHSRDDLISVFLVPAAEYSIPDKLQKTHVERDGQSFFDHNCRGCRLVYHRTGNAVVITASTTRNTDLLDFVPGQASI